MICPNCQTANPDSARFCMNCGYSLAPAALCPNCGVPRLPGARFCHNCGYAFERPGQETAAPSAAGQSSNLLQKFIPRELLNKLQAVRSGRSMEGERRVVTMLFCDVKGSTSMAERLDPEDWAEVMNGAFEHLIPPIFRYEGMIPRLMGDAILAFFGAPIAHEDDPERAVRAGLEMVEAIQGYRQQILEQRGLDFDVRVGINTGLVVVGEVGTDLRLEYTAMGDAINLAARMEQTAQPGTVQITDRTYALVAPLFDVEPLGGIEVKGKREPVRSYRVLRPKLAPMRLFGIAGVKTPLVGREPELRALRERVDRLHQGQGGIICLIGDAGLGKSRLIAELQQEWESRSAGGPPGAWDVVSAASFAAFRPYGQLRQHLIEHMGIREADPPETVREKIRAMYSGDLAGLRDRAISIYGRLLGIEGAPTGPRGSAQAALIEAETFRQELFDLVLSFQRLWLGGRPGVQVFDDLHWGDPASTELLIHLLQLTRQAPVLYLLAFRPESDSPVWSIREAARTEYGERYTEVVLDPLPEPDTRTLIGHLFSEAGPPPDLLRQLLEKAEGNPLFVEEVVRELLDAGVVGRGAEGLRWTASQEPVELALPDSLHALVTARLDRLEEDTRRTLQLASVLGRSFYYKVLRQITNTAVKLDQELQKLQDSDLILEARRLPELEFRFRHAMTQEAAYQSILVRHRREYHRRVAEALKTLFDGRLEEYADLLAHHYDAAGDPRARRYYRLAGEKAAQLYASREALAYYTRALELPDGAASPEETLAIRAGRGEIYFTLGNFEQASTDLEAALEIARAADLHKQESRLLMNLAWLRWSSGRGAEALELARQAEAQARARGDPALMLQASVMLGTALLNLGQIQEARLRLRQALTASRRQAEIRPQAFSFHQLAIEENFSGRFGRAVVLARRAYELFLQIGDRRMATGILFYESLAEGGRGRYDQALAVLEAGRRLAEEISSLWGERYPNQRAWLSAELGDWETAYEIDLGGLHSAQQVPGFREIEISTLINLVLDCTALGRLAEAAQYLEESQKDLGRPEFGSHNWRWSLRLADAQARLHLAQGDPKGAAQSVARLLDQAQRLEARKYTARGLALQAQVHWAQGAIAEAETSLLAALQLADSLCYLPLRVEARQRLGELYRQTGQDERAGQHSAAAAELITVLDAQLQHPELRRSFERGMGRKRDSGEQ